MVEEGYKYVIINNKAIVLMRRLKKNKIFSILLTVVLIITLYNVFHDFFLEYFFRGKRLSFVDYIAKGVAELLGLDTNWLFADRYEGTSFIFKSLSRPTVIIYFLVVTLVSIKLNFFNPWKFYFKDKSYIKYLPFAFAIILTWTYSMNDYNIYYDQAYYIDRILLIGFTVLFWFYPVIIVYYLPIMFLQMGQFYAPNSSYLLTDKYMVFNDLFFFYGWIVLFLVWEKFKNKLPKIEISDWVNIIIMFFLVVHGAAYFLPFLEKILIDGSPNEGGLALGTSQFLQRGWLKGHCDLTFVKTLIESVKSVELVLMWATFIVQGAGLFITANRKLAILVLLCTSGFNFFVFLISGIFFWKWILANLVLILFIIKFKPDLFKPENSIYKYIGIGVIAISYFVITSPLLGWHFLPFSNNHVIEVVTRSGSHKMVNPHEIYGYDTFFQNPNNFLPAYDGQHVSGYTIDHYIWKKTKNKTVKQLEDYRVEFGINNYSENKVNLLQSFIKRYFKNFNSRLESGGWINSKVGCWRHTYKWNSCYTSNVFDFSAPVSEIKIYRDECIYNQKFFYDCDKILILEIDVPR